MNLKRLNSKRINCQKSILVFLILILFTSLDLYTQDYTITLKQRRMGDQIGVEFWLKGDNADVHKIGKMSIAATYNTAHLNPANSDTYDIRYADSVDSNVEQNAPLPYRTFTSNFHNANGYSSLKALAENDASFYVYNMSFEIPSLPSDDDFTPFKEGIGSFVGKLVFDIIDHNNLTIEDMTDISFNESEALGKFIFLDSDGNDLTSKVEIINSKNMKIKGITILNPNGPNEIVDRDKEFSSMSTAGYPIYFERSGLFTPSPVSRYGSNKLAYAFDYVVNYEESLSDGKQEWVEFLRIAEHRESSYGLGGSLKNHNSGEVTTSNGMGSGFFITQGNGEQLQVGSGDGYGGVLRVVWDEDATFEHSTEKARLRIRQLDTVGINENITLRDNIEDEIYDISDANFILTSIELSVETDLMFENLSIYPNPTNDFINVKTENPILIELYDLLGNKLLEEVNTKIDISHLNSGTYYIKFQNQTKVIVKI